MSCAATLHRPKGSVEQDESNNRFILPLSHPYSLRSDGSRLDKIINAVMGGITDVRCKSLSALVRSRPVVVPHHGANGKRSHVDWTTYPEIKIDRNEV